MQELLSQNDIHWKNRKIGGSKLTIGDYGCALTCVSMTSAEFGGFVDPAHIADNDFNFTPDGLIIWQRTEKFVPVVRFVWRQYGYSPETIKNFLAYGKKATHVQVPINAKRGEYHWLKVVAIVKLKSGIDYLCSNPWSGTRCYALATYGKITGSAHFIKP